MHNSNSFWLHFRQILVLFMGMFCFVLTLGLRSCVGFAVRLSYIDGSSGKPLSDHDKQSLTIANVILVIGFLVFVLSCFIAWKWNSRPKLGHCNECGYDLRGLPLKADTKCPECGEPVLDKKAG